MALGSAIADSLIGTILDICSDALKKMGWVERASVTAKVAEDVSKSIKVSYCTIMMIDIYVSMCTIRVIHCCRTSLLLFNLLDLI